MRYNTTLEANGVSIVNGTKITFSAGGVYNIQFSAQFAKSDSGTDFVDIWLRQNGVNVPNSNTRLRSTGNDDQFVASWNFMQTMNVNDYLELIWLSADTDISILANEGTSTIPGIPSVILTVQQVMYTQLGPTGPQGNQGTTSGKLYYLNESITGSAGPGYYQLGTSAVLSPTGYTISVTLPAAGNSGSLGEFITDFNEPGTAFIPPGIWNATMFLSATESPGGGAPLTDIQTYIEYYTYGSTGIQTFIDRSSIQPITTTSAAPYQLSAQFNQTPLNVSDRILMKIKCYNASSPSKSISVTAYYQDNTYSNLVTSYATSATTFYQEGPVINISTGTLDNYLLSSETFFLMSGAAAPCTISGFQNGLNGRFITLINNSANTITFANESTSSTDVNRFFLYPTAGVEVKVQGSISFIYVSNIKTGRWAMTSNT